MQSCLRVFLFLQGTNIICKPSPGPASGTGSRLTIPKAWSHVHPIFAKNLQRKGNRSTYQILPLQTMGQPFFEQPTFPKAWFGATLSITCQRVFFANLPEEEGQKNQDSQLHTSLRLYVIFHLWPGHRLLHKNSAFRLLQQTEGEMIKQWLP